MDTRTGEVISMEEALRRNAAAGSDVCIPLPAIHECSIEEGIQKIKDATKIIVDEEKPITDKLPEYGTPIGQIKNSWRNKPCRCGSFVKYKHCCMANDKIANHQLRLQEMGNAQKPIHPLTDV